MATKKPGKGIAVPKGKAVANIDAQLAQEATNISNQIGAAATQAISTKEKVFTLPDGLVLKSPIQVVVIDFLSFNGYYPGRYDAANPKPPECYAISKSAKNITPSLNSLDRQADSCNECPLNEFGSNGTGKACKNTRLLAVMLANDDPIDGDVYTLSVSPTALKNFDGYVNSISQLFGAPPIKVITEVQFHPEKDYPSLMFGNPQPNPQYAEHFSRRAEATILLEAEPDYPGIEAPKAKEKTTRRKG